MKKIAIIGANSFIARNFIYSLKKSKYDINLYDYQEQQLDGLNNYMSINIMDLSSLEKIDYNVDAIYLFVGKTGTLEGFNNYNLFIDLNEIALLNILNKYVQKKSKAKIIFPSTRLVYKGSEKPIYENSPKEFKTIYAINKFACEMYLKQFNLMYNVQYAILRICVPYGTLIPNVYSYGTAEFMINNAKNKRMISLYGDGKIYRTLTFIGDLCYVLEQVGLNKKCINDVYNVGGEKISLLEMAEYISDIYKSEIKFVDWPRDSKLIETGSTSFNFDKLNQIVNVEYDGKFYEWCNNQKIKL